MNEELKETLAMLRETIDLLRETIDLLRNGDPPNFSDGTAICGGTTYELPKGGLRYYKDGSIPTVKGGQYQSYIFSADSLETPNVG